MVRARSLEVLPVEWRVRVALLTTLALIGFSANSLLTRAGLGAGRIDAASFTCVRIMSGAVMLALLVRLRPARALTRTAIDVLSPAMLAGYAVLFTLAYGRIGAGVGALILFGAVQATMIGTGLVRGERPRLLDWVGVALAVAGLLVFAVPGASAPDPLGTALMAGAGACWGVYSLLGHAGGDALARTARNFAWAVIPAVIFLGLARAQTHVTTSGLLMAAASGALASGVGYTLWYAALPSLTAWRAGIVQLVVPVMTAIAATLLLGESITPRLLVATALVAAGVVQGVGFGLRQNATTVTRGR